MLRHFILKLSHKHALISGALFLLLAGTLLWSSTGESISASDTQRCREQVTQKYGQPPADLLAQCATSVGWVAMQNAEANGGGAEAVAMAVSKANQSSHGPHFVIMAFIGLFLALGLALLARGALGLVKKTN